MKRIPSTVGLVVCSMSGQTKLIRDIRVSNGTLAQAVVDSRLPVRSTGVLLWNFVEKWDDNGRYPVVWPSGIGYHAKSDLMFFVDDKWYLLEAHLEGGISKDLWKAIEDL